jgi:hypothetical protein
MKFPLKPVLDHLFVILDSQDNHGFMTIRNQFGDSAAKLQVYKD